MSETYRSWEPVADLPQGAGSRLVELRDDAAGLSIALEFDARPGELLHLVFHSPLAHRRSSFEVFIRMWRMEVPHRLYLVENSRWIEWLHEESDGRYVSASLAHYVITTSRDFVELLAADPPESEWRAA
jgi:hypothetical protein